MKLHPRLTRSCIELVKRFEGFRPSAAKTPDGGFTLGYGHTLTAREGAVVSEADADALLRFDLSRVAFMLDEALLAPVNDNQFSALISFAFNIGPENFKGSSAARHLAEGAYLQAAAAIELWRRADFDGDALVVDALVRRRAAEKALFLTPPEGFAPAPSSVLRPSFDHSVIGAAVAWAAARERTAVSRIALEGAMTSSDLAVPPGREGEPAPSAAIAAADALTVRLSRILPDEPETPALSESAPPEPLALVSEPEEEAAPAAEEDAAPAVAEAADEAVEPPATLAQPLRSEAPQRIFDSGFDLPPPPVPAGDAVDFQPTPPDAPAVEAPAFVSRPETDAPARLTPVDFTRTETPVEPPPLVDASPADLPAADAFGPATEEPPPAPMVFGARRRRFGPRPPVGFTPSQAYPETPFPLAAEAEEPAFAPPEPTLFDPPAADFDRAFAPTETAAPSQVEAPSRPVTPLFENPLFFAGLGLIGVALFAGSIFCMINRASFGCLLIGVVGVLAMAPAAAFFLFRFLGQPVDPASEEHADLLQATHVEAAPVGAEPDAPRDIFARDDSWR